MPGVRNPFSPPPPEKKPPPEPEPEELGEDEYTREQRWRFVGLLDRGFAPQQAELMIDRPDVVHEAEALLAKGMPHEFVVNELT